MYTCRECENVVNTATEVCPHCGADLTAAGEEQPKKKPSLISVLLRYAVVVGAVWAFLLYILPDRSSNPRVKAETAALETLREMQQVLAAYAQAQGGAFPTSLEELGERARLPAQRGQAEGYRLNYTPGPAGADGNSNTFGLQARAGNYGYRNFFIDQTGVIRATEQNRPATVEDSPI